MTDPRPGAGGICARSGAASAGRWLLPALFLLSLLLFAANASLGLASDDVAWLYGQGGTAVDAHRVLPQLLFAGLRILFGPSVVAALTTIWLLHALNGWLLYRLAGSLLGGRAARLAAVAVFLINPLTLGSLTWISCLAYVLGTTFALAAVLAARQALQAGDGPSLGWAATALAALGLGLFCNYDLVLLPAVWAVLAWYEGRLRRGLWLAAAGLALALPVGTFGWAIADPGLRPWELLSGRAALAYASSGLASALALGMAYPVSFFGTTTGFLQACFSEPARWVLTSLALGVGILGYDGRPAWRTFLALALSTAALLAPFGARLILTPGAGSYHPSYILSGRLYYLPFVGIALLLGHLSGLVHCRLSARLPAWFFWALPAVGTGLALWRYQPADFVGLSLVPAGNGTPPAAWAPFAGQHPAWLLLPLAAVALALALRRAGARSREPSPAG
jgi:hypothetical protein